MPHPIVCQDERLRQYLQSFQALFSRPQYEHFVTVLMALKFSFRRVYALSSEAYNCRHKEPIELKSFPFKLSLESPTSDTVQLHPFL